MFECGDVEKVRQTLLEYHWHVRAIAKGATVFFYRFIWEWPLTADQERPHIFTCEDAERAAAITSWDMPRFDSLAHQDVLALLRQTRGIQLPTFPGITKATMHEVADHFGWAFGRIFRAVQAPAYTGEDLDAITDDYFECCNEESNVEGWVDPRITGSLDSFPEGGMRIRADWHNYQWQVKQLIERNLHGIDRVDLDRMGAEIEQEFATASRRLLEIRHDALAEAASRAGGAEPIAVEVAETPPADLAKVILRGEHQGPIVLGREKPPLTARQHTVIQTLLEADQGLTKDELDDKSGHTEARKALYELRREDPDWAEVIVTPGKGWNGGYRIKK